MAFTPITPATGADSSFTPLSPQTTPNSPNVFQRVGGAVANSVNSIGADLNQNKAVQNGNGSTLNKLGSEIATGAHIAGSITGAPIKAAVAATPEALQNFLGTVAHGAVSMVQSNPKAAMALAQVHQIASEHPQIAEFLSGITSTAGNVATLGGGFGAVKSLVNTGLDISKTASTAEGLAKAITPATETVKAVSPEAEAVSNMISPKLTPTEVKIALKEGRIQPGEKPGFLSDGTPDTVLPSGKDIKAGNTIAEVIPNASKMTKPELYTALDKQVGTIAKGLRPVMESTPIQEGTVEKITNEWGAVKAKQLKDPYSPFDKEKIATIQQHFEQEFLMGSKADNLGDLWDTRIKYDNTVPDNVKKATSLSSETLQAQKSMWLQNRGVLNAAIEDAANGLKGASKKAFSQMTDMYQGMRGIESSYTIPKTGAPSTAKKILNSKPFKAAEVGAGGIAGYEVVKKLIQ